MRDGNRQEPNKARHLTAIPLRSIAAGELGRFTYYYKIKDKLNKKISDKKIKDKIKEISYKHLYYGYRRITAELKRDKLIVNHKRVLRMMKQMGIQARIKRKYIATTNSKHHNRIYPNLIKGKRVTGNNQIWCAGYFYLY